jgi:hypothetical protein
MVIAPRFCTLLPYLSLLISACSVYDSELVKELETDAGRVDGAVGSEGGVAGNGGGSTDDAGPDDTGPVDAGPDDTGPVDTGPVDARFDASDCEPGNDKFCPWICPEVCDDRDNDCDGQTDEGELWADKGEECFEGLGECRVKGKLVCDEADPAGELLCDAVALEIQPEICDGEDNDCDGETDESSPDTDQDGIADCVDSDDDGDGVIDTVDNCVLQPNLDQTNTDGDTAGDACDADDDNDDDPDSSDCAPLDPAIYNGADEVCGDEADNDCDGQTDEYCWIVFDYSPSNFDPDDLDPGSAPNVTLDCAATYNSSNPSDFSQWCGQPAPNVEIDTAPDPDVVIITFHTLSITATGSLTLSGDKPVILAVFGDTIIDGTVDASANFEIPGPGGDDAASPGTICTSGGNGQGNRNSTSFDHGGGGGGGGGFGQDGARGGNGFNGASGGSGGSTEGNAALVPLRGGCSGGRGGYGGQGTNGNRWGGAGGGAVQISVAGTLTLNSTAVIAAAGGGGKGGDDDEDGGGGGGSGGAILLEGGAVLIDPDAWITANGGSGAEGNDTDSRVPGGSGGEGYGGDGGYGGAQQGAASNGGNGSGGFFGAGGGGGGGGVGRIRINQG